MEDQNRSDREQDRRNETSSSWTIHPWVAEGQHKIRFGAQMADQGTDWQEQRDWVQMVENLGFDSFWVSDHPFLSQDAWITLTIAAQATRKIRLGTLVSCIFYRSPALLARLAADVDRLSNGRVILGVGIGDLPQEFERLGIQLQSVKERQQALEKAIQTIVELWQSEDFAWQGTPLQTQQMRLAGVPVQQPRIPLLIAGGGERVTLRQVAQYADVSNFGAHAVMGGAYDLSDVARKYAALRRHSEAQGRPYNTVLRSHLTFPLVLAETPEALRIKLDRLPQGWLKMFRSSLIAGVPQEVLSFYQALASAGVQYFICSLFRGDGETLQLLAEQIMPALKEAPTLL
ncbi:LLM class flavin-dependent oxidoreductase [Ktedonosporobacter rubrisoli]|uniref:LLM class flavin-dependent oxidoreductase n=1 Tax=Ktedonosporobacter rubrisoli TaxID=2509675 RepID=A0A4P6JVN5_KTERU|nr:LLM class flavin-dependent oxidoreductase [Ktedonosporobacter rubrisoli]QBD79505.1 LLM class flavin-dependent oxidoreductase [Ktedonosporobacter rubrisoli]